MSLLQRIVLISVTVFALLYFLGIKAGHESDFSNIPRPEIEFAITKDDSDHYRRRVDVLLSEKISKAELEDIAEYLVKDGASNTLIGYRIEGDSDYGYWATTNYTPDLSIRVIGTASELGTDMENQSVSADTGEISREEYGENWPFTVDSGRLECWRGPAAVFVTDGTVYQLNGVAKQMGHAPIDPIWRDNPAIPGTKISLGPVIQRALKLCN